MHLESSVFQQNGLIPAKYTCNGEDISPPLKWGEYPLHTKSFVLICDDPDAPKGTWDHWVLYNIPENCHSFPENMTLLPSGTQEGMNSWGKTGYGGPCPPDREHRYFFTLYALDTLLSFPKTPKKQDIEKAMKGHILAEATLMGRYNQPR
ncbi:MAG: YbhB/YbcL family Raf kinase inhibitor-like protein [Proteobacteria bacterium]|nr:YbhB/YbcL family Raf kinase inhibitor-like protein [Pseudomonadota bacterium]